MADKKKFAEITKLVIDNLEGGYWNPAWHGVPAGYENSGETMYGIDRVAGGAVQNDSPAGKKFWSLVDANKNPSVWKWGYIPPEPLKSQLRDAAVDVMYGQYQQYANRYLTNAKAKNIIENDGRLLFHMAYASWNGPAWFKKFSNDLNSKVDSGVTNPDELAKVAIASRTQEGLKTGSPPNKLIAQGGKKIESLSSKLMSLASAGVEKAKQNPITTALITVAVVVSAYILITQFNKN